MTPEFVQWNSWIMCKCANGSLGSDVEGGDRKSHRTTDNQIEFWRLQGRSTKMVREKYVEGQIVWGPEKQTNKQTNLKICLSLSKSFGWR